VQEVTVAVVLVALTLVVRQVMELLVQQILEVAVVEPTILILELAALVVLVLSLFATSRQVPQAKPSLVVLPQLQVYTPLEHSQHREVW
jgi:hypothetical protein